jgi:hypothetical protein
MTIGVPRLSLSMNSSREETYQFLTDYFHEKRMKVIASNAPSYVKVRFGSWGFLNTQFDPKCEAEVNVAERDGGSSVSFSFVFFRRYLGETLAIMFGALLLFFLQQSIALSFYPSGFNWLFVGAFNAVLLAEAIVLLDLLAGLSGYTKWQARKGFVDGFSKFAQERKKAIANTSARVAD